MKTISLAGGQLALVDDDDYHRLSTFKWYPKRSGSGKVTYAVRYIRTVQGRRSIKMHHDITGVQRLDHRDGDGLNNQRQNLRPATNRENQGNSPPKKGRRFKGAFPSSCGFFARCAGKYLGHFNSELLAATAYNAEAVKVFGEFARLNSFTPEEIEALQEIQ